MLEKKVEEKSQLYATKHGWYGRKFTSPARRSVPDRLFAKDSFVFWVEFKATGGKASPAQLEEHRTLAKHNCIVFVCDCPEKFKDILSLMEMLR